MLIADEFTFVHLPKTGGTFVTRLLKETLVPSAVLRGLHEVRRKYGLAIPGVRYRYRELDKHLFVRRMPADARDRPLVTSVRNPLDLYVSQFKFGWWRENPDKWFAAPAAAIADHGPVDDWTFETFVRGTLDHSHWATKYPVSPDAPGRFAAEWAHFFCPRPAEVFSSGDVGEQLAALTAQMPPVRYLHQETLNDDLADFLVDLGVDADRVAEVRSHAPILPGARRRPHGEGWPKHYTPELESLVRDREKLLFALLPEYADEAQELTAEGR